MCNNENYSCDVEIKSERMDEYPEFPNTSINTGIKQEPVDIKEEPVDPDDFPVPGKRTTNRTRSQPSEKLFLNVEFVSSEKTGS